MKKMAVNLEDAKKAFLAMIIYGLVILLFSILTSKFIGFRRLVAGKPLILYDKDQLYYSNLKKSKLDVSEFFVQCRNSGYFDLSTIETVVLESNGNLSILPKAAQRPVTPKDIGVNPKQDYLVANVIIDGKILKKNLQHTGKEEIWLRKELSAKGYGDISKIFLATCDMDNTLTVYEKIDKSMEIDVFE